MIFLYSSVLCHYFSDLLCYYILDVV